MPNLDRLAFGLFNMPNLDLGREIGNRSCYFIDKIIVKCFICYINELVSEFEDLEKFWKRSAECDFWV